MATPVALPYPPLLLLETNGAITWSQLLTAIGRRLATGVSVCIIPGNGDPRRGGYFFHFKEEDGMIIFRTFDRDCVCTLRPGKECAAFINHVTGQRYDETMWRLSQHVNLRSD